ncbi:MAG TPA: hypothetical protein VM509_12930 [Planctomycetota bacterium]|nr:hypothetical protein [Planctomycetota bacterium]
MELEHLHFLLWTTTAVLALALVLVAKWHAVNRARIGRVRWNVRRRSRARVLIFAGAFAVSAAIVAGSTIAREPATLAMLALALALLAVSPGFQDSTWGERGVRRGWYARRYEDLEAWRLIGEHLRWKLFGEWVATDVPSAEHAALRAELEKRAPGRESIHGNAGLDPQRAAAAKSNS